MNIKYCWLVLWLIIATPFAYVVIICALIGAGVDASRQWSKEFNLPWI